MNILHPTPTVERSPPKLLKSCLVHFYRLKPLQDNRQLFSQSKNASLLCYGSPELFNISFHLFYVRCKN
jgi:hypothetical protein